MRASQKKAYTVHTHTIYVFKGYIMQYADCAAGPPWHHMEATRTLIGYLHFPDEGRFCQEGSKEAHSVIFIF